MRMIIGNNLRTRSAILMIYNKKININLTKSIHWLILFNEIFANLWLNVYQAD